MKAYYLFFQSSEAGYAQLLPLFGLEGDLPAAGEGFALDLIGTLHKAPIEVAEDAEPEPPIPIQGWHVNLRLDGDLPDSLKPFEVHPVTPSVVWL